jgi:putative FmdB family regulatory protein
MPVYEYQCRTCDSRFEARRPMSEATSPIKCPDGHDNTTRLLSVFASVGRSGGSMAPQPGAVRPAGGGCGPGCACAV